MGYWKRRADALDPGRPPAEHDNELYLSKTLDARGELRGSLDADITALLAAALRVADPKDFGITLPERRAHALAQICQTFLDHQHTAEFTHPDGRVETSYPRGPVVQPIWRQPPDGS